LGEKNKKNKTKKEELKIQEENKIIEDLENQVQDKEEELRKEIKLAEKII
jgi:hypothetical protein